MKLNPADDGRYDAYERARIYGNIAWARWEDEAELHWTHYLAAAIELVPVLVAKSKCWGCGEFGYEIGCNCGPA